MGTEETIPAREPEGLNEHLLEVWRQACREIISSLAAKRDDLAEKRALIKKRSRSAAEEFGVEMDRLNDEIEKTFSAETQLRHVLKLIEEQATPGATSEPAVVFLPDDRPWTPPQPKSSSEGLTDEELGERDDKREGRLVPPKETTE